MKNLPIIILLLVMLPPGYAQKDVIKKQFQACYVDEEKGMVIDTTLNVIFTLEKGNVKDVSIFAADYDRTHVQTAKIAFNGNNLANLPSFIKTLKHSIKKYNQWKETAKKNNIQDFYKDMGNGTSIKEHRLEFAFRSDNLWYVTQMSSSGGLPMWLVSPAFRVYRGIPLILIGKYDVQGLRYAKKKKTKVYIDLRGEEQMMSLIDALNADDEIQQIRERINKEKEEKESIDALFK